jgi:hypothetical protein
MRKIVQPRNFHPETILSNCIFCTSAVGCYILTKIPIIVYVTYRFAHFTTPEGILRRNAQESFDKFLVFFQLPQISMNA